MIFEESKNEDHNMISGLNLGIQMTVRMIEWIKSRCLEHASFSELELDLTEIVKVFAEIPIKELFESTNE